MKVNIVLEEGGIMPKKEFPSSAGYDLFAPKDTLIPLGRSIVPLNFKMQLTEGYGAFVLSRSGTSAKGTKGSRDSQFSTVYRFDSDVMLGLIDCDYRGTCKEGRVICSNGYHASYGCGVQRSN